MCEQKADDVSCFVTCVKRLGSSHTITAFFMLIEKKIAI